MSLPMSAEYERYFQSIRRELGRVYDICATARMKSIDPKPKPEPRITEDLAERVEFLVGPPQIGQRIRELSKDIEREEMAFKVAEEIVYGAYTRMEEAAAAEQALRTALAILSEGVTVAPIQGITRVMFKQNADKTRYLAVYFAGPIRPAGGTEQALILVIADFIRKKLGLDRYKPTQNEVKRFIEEVRLYEREVRLFQYHVPDEVLERILENLPVEVTGVETDPYEVTSFRNLPRIETNRVRGGALIVVNDGLAGRSRKVQKIIEGLGIEGWSWLETVWQTEGKETTLAEAMYMEEVIAGRPVFSSPSRPGGFRLRYGRARNTGLAALGIHPATMVILSDFLAIGTQLRIERPGKAGIVAAVDSIEPPMVKLRDGSVIRVETLEQARRVSQKVEKVLFLGDILVSFYEFLENKKLLVPCGLTEEEWGQRLQATINQGFNSDIAKVAEAAMVSPERLRQFTEKPRSFQPSTEEALGIAEGLGVPLHPKYTYNWTMVSAENVNELKEWLTLMENVEKESCLVEAHLPYDAGGKETLERLLIPHRVEDGKVILGEDAHILSHCLRLDKPELRVDGGRSVLEALKNLSGITIEPKALTYIGTKMGRPEKAKRREMKPLVHVLFPVGLGGGPRRDLKDASLSNAITVELVTRRCVKCQGLTYLPLCPICGETAVLELSCPRCTRTFKDQEATCPSCGIQARGWQPQTVNLKEKLEYAAKRVGVPPNGLVKGVRGLTSKNKVPEPLEKGILRAKNDLSVFKDGTVRFDATNAPLTHFRPNEVGTTIERLKQLGYTKDTEGKPLTDPSQICELMVQDVVISHACGRYLIRLASFIDELLQKVYGLEKFYNVQREEDLIGHLIVGLAPHTSVGVIGRVTGFTPANVCFAHPYWHAAKRRDADGDEDSVILTVDCFLNFSVEYLPAQVGGLMDAPLLVTPTINPYEVDSAVHNLDLAPSYPLVFYEKCRQGEDPRRLCEVMDVVVNRLGTEAQFQGFSYTHETSDITLGNLESAYKKLETMESKVASQLSLASKLAAVEVKEVAEKIIASHFIRDLAGNLKTFSGQKFRCKKCGLRLRRVPLSGKCPKCGGDLNLTVHRGSVEKYVDVALTLAEKYGVKDYYVQRITMINDEITSLFGEKKGKAQQDLGRFM